MSTKKSTVRKTAISVSRPLLDAVDRAAKQRGESRSRFIARVLEQAVKARRDADITRRLNELFQDETLSRSQRDEANELDRIGTSFFDEAF